MVCLEKCKIHHYIVGTFHDYFQRALKNTPENLENVLFGETQNAHSTLTFWD